MDNNGGLGRERLNDAGCAFGKVNRERLSHVHERVDELNRRMEGLATNQTVKALDEKVEGLATKFWQIQMLIITQLVVIIVGAFWLIVNHALP